MPTYARREIVTTRVEYGVEARPFGNGAHGGEFAKVWAIAWADYKRRHGLPDDATEYDNWCRIEPRDEEVVIVFSVDREVSS